jgi:hypothetical protein
MSRKLKASVAQLGPIHLADTRSAVVKRLTALRAPGLWSFPNSR